ncbi:MAG: hypothetical protein M3Q36_01630 [bacterium]|nr:hypothetical protein [bacterium]
MASYKKKIDFFTTEEGMNYVQKLRDMALDMTYHTDSSYSTNSDAYPDNQIPFVNKHMEYIRSHPALDPQQYLSNLRLMTRVR